ncbi:hypothetical protein IAT38_002593 [Cryptococcus sp. DSM 104549]
MLRAIFGLATGLMAFLFFGPPPGLNLPILSLPPIPRLSLPFYHQPLQVDGPVIATISAPYVVTAAPTLPSDAAALAAVLGSDSSYLSPEDDTPHGASSTPGSTIESADASTKAVWAAHTTGQATREETPARPASAALLGASGTWTASEGPNTQSCSALPFGPSSGWLGSVVKTLFLAADLADVILPEAVFNPHASGYDLLSCTLRLYLVFVVLVALLTLGFVLRQQCRARNQRLVFPRVRARTAIGTEGFWLKVGRADYPAHDLPGDEDVVSQLVRCMSWACSCIWDLIWSPGKWFTDTSGKSDLELLGAPDSDNGTWGGSGNWWSRSTHLHDPSLIIYNGELQARVWTDSGWVFASVEPGPSSPPAERLASLSVAGVPVESVDSAAEETVSANTSASTEVTTVSEDEAERPLPPLENVNEVANIGPHRSDPAHGSRYTRPTIRRDSSVPPTSMTPEPDALPTQGPVVRQTSRKSIAAGRCVVKAREKSGVVPTTATPDTLASSTGTLPSSSSSVSAPSSQPVDSSLSGDESQDEREADLERAKAWAVARAKAAEIRGGLPRSLALEARLFIQASNPEWLREAANSEPRPSRFQIRRPPPLVTQRTALTGYTGTTPVRYPHIARAPVGSSRSALEDESTGMEQARRSFQPREPSLSASERTPSAQTTPMPVLRSRALVQEHLEAATANTNPLAMPALIERINARHRERAMRSSMPVSYGVSEPNSLTGVSGKTEVRDPVVDRSVEVPVMGRGARSLGEARGEVEGERTTRERVKARAQEKVLPWKQALPHRQNSSCVANASTLDNSAGSVGDSNVPATPISTRTPLLVWSPSTERPLVFSKDEVQASTQASRTDSEHASVSSSTPVGRNEGLHGSVGRVWRRDEVEEMGCEEMVEEDVRKDVGESSREGAGGSWEDVSWLERWKADQRREAEDLVRLERETEEAERQSREKRRAEERAAYKATPVASPVLSKSPVVSRLTAGLRAVAGRPVIKRATAPSPATANRIASERSAERFSLEAAQPVLGLGVGVGRGGEEEEARDRKVEVELARGRAEEVERSLAGLCEPSDANESSNLSLITRSATSASPTRASVYGTKEGESVCVSDQTFSPAPPRFHQRCDPISWEGTNRAEGISRADLSALTFDPKEVNAEARYGWRAEVERVMQELGEQEREAQERWAQEEREAQERGEELDRRVADLQAFVEGLMADSMTAPMAHSATSASLTGASVHGTPTGDGSEYFSDHDFRLGTAQPNPRCASHARDDTERHALGGPDMDEGFSVADLSVLTLGIRGPSPASETAGFHPPPVFGAVPDEAYALVAVLEAAGLLSPPDLDDPVISQQSLGCLAAVSIRDGASEKWWAVWMGLLSAVRERGAEEALERERDQRMVGDEEGRQAVNAAASRTSSWASGHPTFSGYASPELFTPLPTPRSRFGATKEILPAARGPEVKTPLSPELQDEAQPRLYPAVWPPTPAPGDFTSPGDSRPWHVRGNGPGWASSTPLWAVGHSPASSYASRELSPPTIRAPGSRSGATREESLTVAHALSAKASPELQQEEVQPRLSTAWPPTPDPDETLAPSDSRPWHVRGDGPDWVSSTPAWAASGHQAALGNALRDPSSPPTPTRCRTPPPPAAATAPPAPAPPSRVRPRLTTLAKTVKVPCTTFRAVLQQQADARLGRRRPPPNPSPTPARGLTRLEHAMHDGPTPRKPMAATQGWTLGMRHARLFEAIEEAAHVPELKQEVQSRLPAAAWPPLPDYDPSGIPGFDTPWRAREHGAKWYESTPVARAPQAVARIAPEHEVHPRLCSASPVRYPTTPYPRGRSSRSVSPPTSGVESSPVAPAPSDEATPRASRAPRRPPTPGHALEPLQALSGQRHESSLRTPRASESVEKRRAEPVVFTVGSNGEVRVPGTPGKGRSGGRRPRIREGWV